MLSIDPANPEHLVRARLVGDLSMLTLGERFADPLYAALQKRGFGRITGGNAQQNDAGQTEWISIDLQLVNLDEALAFARCTLQELGAPPGSELAYTLDGETVTQPIDAPLVV